MHPFFFFERLLFLYIITTSKTLQISHLYRKHFSTPILIPSILRDVVARLKLGLKRQIRGDTGGKTFFSKFPVTLLNVLAGGWAVGRLRHWLNVSVVNLRLVLQRSGAPSTICTPRHQNAVPALPPSSAQNAPSSFTNLKVSWQVTDVKTLVCASRVFLTPPTLTV